MGSVAPSQLQGCLFDPEPQLRFLVLSEYLCGFPPGSPASSQSLKTCHCAKFLLGVNVYGAL